MSRELAAPGAPRAPAGVADTALPGTVSQPWQRAAAAWPGSAASQSLHPRQLAAAWRRSLEQGLHGLCFSPYGPGQRPGMQVDESAIAERLALIRPYTRWIRSFSCTMGHQATPRLARRAGLRTLVGAWLGSDEERNREEIDGLVELARAGVVDIAAVGNEVLLRGALDEPALLAYIEQVRARAPGVPVGYVDAYFLFEKHPRVTAACDVVLVNCYPFWEGCPREQALQAMQSMYLRAVAAAAGRPVLIAETGWPDRGAAQGASQPSEDDAMRYFIDAQHWARLSGVPMFYFSSFDEAWKADAEGDVGVAWGLWDEQGRLKHG